MTFGRRVDTAGSSPRVGEVRHCRDARRWHPQTRCPGGHEEVAHAERDHDSGLGRHAPATGPRVTAPMTPQTRMPRTRTQPAAHAAPSHSPRMRARTPRDPKPRWGAGGDGGDGNTRSGEVPRRAAHRARPPARPPRLATVVPYLAVLVVVVGGVYIAWHQGSHGGGMGGVIAGVAFLIGALVRLVLPAQLAGLLASRNRLTDVVTLVIFGVGLLVLGLVLPR